MNEIQYLSEVFAVLGLLVQIIIFTQFIPFSLGILKKQMEDKKLNITEADNDSQLKPLVSYYKIMSEGSQVKCIVYKIFRSLYISIPEYLTCLATR